jgi:hypothetical protein
MTRKQYLLDTAALLWPGEGRATAGRSGPGRPTHLLVPSATDPRLMVPSARRAGAAAVLGYGGHGSAQAWLKARVLAAAIAAGAGRVVMPGRLWIGDGEPGLDEHLASILGRPVLLALHIGPPRANRKPVLQLLTPRGETLAFAKLGVNELTARLVDVEAAALAAVGAAAPAGIAVPEVLHHGSWHGVQVLVQSALPVRRSRPTPPAQRLAAMAAVARTGADAQGGILDYVRNLRERIAALPDPGAATDLGTAVDRVAAAGRPLTTGAWHGDWTPWNTAFLADPGTVLIWDWERYATGVPVGFDAIHHHLQTGLAAARGRPLTPAVALATIAAAPELLAPFGAAAPAAADTAVLYLAEIASRYLADNQAQAGGAVGRVGEWLLPALRAAPTASPARP